MTHFVDLHCHPSLKPFSWAFRFNNSNDSDVSKRNSIWHDDPPEICDKIINCLGVTRFSQSNFTALFKGNVKVVMVALNPPEKTFFSSRPGTSGFADRIYFFITEFFKGKLDFIQSNNDYFSELCEEYNFYLQLHDTFVQINGASGPQVKYKLTSNFNDIIVNQMSPDIISVIFSMEGGHVFNQFANRRAEENEILHKIQIVKGWAYAPRFINLSHHFYNEMGGHARSLSGIVSRAIDQTHGMDTGITSLGKKVINSLLSTHNGKRIYIDIKHMSRKTRIEYYKLLKTRYAGEKIPVYVSHGAVNGYKSVYTPGPYAEDNGRFWGRDINFFDDELLKIYDTDGIFGIQIDERVLSSKAERRKIKAYYSKKDKMKMRAGLVWNQIEHIAKTLYNNGRDPWKISALGTDFDGIVDPPDGYWTSVEFQLLYDSLLEHAREYFSNANNPVCQANPPVTPQIVMDKIFSDNAMRFFSSYYQ